MTVAGLTRRGAIDISTSDRSWSVIGLFVAIIAIKGFDHAERQRSRTQEPPQHLSHLCQEWRDYCDPGPEFARSPIDPVLRPRIQPRKT